ncbi:MLP-like protein [Vigna angularis]|uniref:MLP-like protein n=1 Tax=Phaseolus angularis TaxID=3914 RepID=A0A8T0JJS8_PHAAN|nr:MLP-like protein [Vigna angularis]
MAYCEVQKLETKVSMKASAEKFYDILCNKTHQLPTISSQNLLSVQIHKGQWGTQGSIISWNYLHEGKVSVVKEMLEDIDKEKKKISFRVIEEELLKHYKSFKIMIQVTPKEKGSTLHCVFEYQKQRHQIPDPHAILQITLQINNKINAYLTHNNVYLEEAAELVFDVFCNKTYCIAKVFPTKVKSIDINEGEWGTEGSITSWKYVHDGNNCVAKEVIGDIDRKNCKVSFKVIEGDLLQKYKSFKFVMQFIPKEDGSVTKLVLEYEKQNYDTPDPVTMLQFGNEVIKKVGDFLKKD